MSGRACFVPDMLTNLYRSSGAKIRINNLHYDLTERDLEVLLDNIFSPCYLRIGADRFVFVCFCRNYFLELDLFFP